MKKPVPDKKLKNPLNRMMPNYAVYVFSLGESLIVYAASFAIGGVVGLIFYSGMFADSYGGPTTATYIANSIFFVLTGFAAVKFLVPLYRTNRAERRYAKLERQFLSLLDSLAASLVSGSNIPMAFENAHKDLLVQYDASDYIIDEVKQVLDGIEQNIGIDVMLHDFGLRSGNENIVNFSDVFYTCYSKGGNMQTTIIRTHSSIREKILIYEEIQTKLTSNKMQLNVMSVMPIGIVAMLRATNPMFAEAFAQPIGVLANTVAIGIFIGAYIYGTKIIKKGTQM
jgi:tight adherence protein B